MDYVVGSVAALISANANVTPNRPKLTKRASTPKKHQPSPNVTPKSEFAEDRSIFLSPSVQRKKAIVKKSPKRIFENPDLDATSDDGEGTSSASPKIKKVKKHLGDDLEENLIANASLKSHKSPKGKRNGSSKPESPKKNLQVDCDENTLEVNIQVSNENTPKKKKKQRNSIVEASGTFKIEEKENLQSEDFLTVVNIGNNAGKSPKKNRKSVTESTGNIVVEEVVHNQEKKPDFTANNENIKKKSKKLKSLNSQNSLQIDSPKKQNQVTETSVETQSNQQKSSKKNKRKKKSKLQNQMKIESEQTSVTQESEKSTDNSESRSPKKKTKKNAAKINAITSKESNSEPESDDEIESSKKKKKKSIVNPNAITSKESNSEPESDDEIESSEKKKKKSIVNPNAITSQDSDSEHESDDEIESETEQANKEILGTGPFEESSDEEEGKKPEKKEQPEKNSDEEVKRTLFIGNVPFSGKIKKEIKKIFSKYGDIETVRVRTVPVKDARFTPKLAIIKNELHPDRSTVNVYVKFTEASSVDLALVENNRVLNEHHLRVSRSDSSGAEHDPRCAVFVGNLPFSIEDDSFRALFVKCGEIHSVRIIRDKKTNAGKGFGYVNFASKDAVELALAMTDEDLMVKNKILRVKRCSQNPRKQSKVTSSNNQGGNQEFQGRNQGGIRGSFRGGNRGGNRGSFRGGNRGSFRGGNRGSFRGGNRGFQDRNQDDNQGFQGRNQGDVGGRGRGGFQGRGRGSFQGRNQGDVQGRSRGGFQGGNRGSFRGRNQGRGGFGRQDGEPNVNGAERRLMHKRKSEEGGDGDGPPNKRANNNQPPREKKERKEFVGMTAEKKKKHKINKGQKKKKELSEILTK